MKDYLDRLAARIDDRSALIGVIGLGYVGLPLAHGLIRSGARVLGFDVDGSKIDALAHGRSYMEHLPAQTFTDLADSDRFSATDDMERLENCDVVVVCVPTPLGNHHEPDLSYVIAAAEHIGAANRPGQLVVLESTTYPGTTRDEFLPALIAAAGGRRTLGHDVFVAYSPEREDPGRAEPSTSIPKLVGGLDEPSQFLARALYSISHDEVVAVPRAEVAEAAKLLENIFRSVNIALVNEMKVILNEMDIDIWEVIDAASTKPFGFMPFHPGPGLGGHCIPIDPFYLTWKAKEVGRSVQFIELAGVVNTRMPTYVVERLTAGLNEAAKPLKGSSVLVIGLAYKANISDTRESPSFELIELIRARGADVAYHDPHIARTVPVRKHDLDMTSTELVPASIAEFDAVVVATAHDQIDWQMVADHAPLVIDTRNVMRPFEKTMGERLVKA